MTPPPPERPRGLGRGLSALIGDEVAAVKGEAAARPRDTRTLPVAFLRPGKYQPRTRFDEQGLEDLAASIRDKGVLSPILVRPLGPDSYEIVAGERRWRAAQIAKLHDVPVLVREMGDDQALEIAIVENVQRTDLGAIEEAMAYRRLMQEFSRTQDQVAAQVGKSRSHVANTLRLLSLPDKVQALVAEGKLSAGHARTLIGAPDALARAMALIEGALSVRAAEQRAQKKKAPRSPAPRDPNIADLETEVSDRLGLKVRIAHKGGGKGDDESGEVRIAYRTLEQLDALLRRLKG